MSLGVDVPPPCALTLRATTAHFVGIKTLTAPTNGRNFLMDVVAPPPYMTSKWDLPVFHLHHNMNLNDRKRNATCGMKVKLGIR
jgi:hypothetical protein